MTDILRCVQSRGKIERDIDLTKYKSFLGRSGIYVFEYKFKRCIGKSLNSCAAATYMQSVYDLS